MPKKNTGQQVDDNERNDDFDTTPTFEEVDFQNGGMYPTYRDRLQEFLDRAELQCGDAVFSLYKYDSPVSTSCALINKYFDQEPPDEHEVGLKYGSGKYLMIMSLPPIGKQKTKTHRQYKFRISQEYDQMRQGAGGAGGDPRQQVYMYPPPQQNNMVEAMTVLQSLIVSLIPLIRPSESPDMNKIMQANMSLVNDVMKKQMMSTVEMMNDYQRRISNVKQIGDESMKQGNEETEPDNSVMDVITQIAPLIAEWLPKLAHGGYQSKLVGNIVKETALFQEIKKSKKMIVGLIRHLDETRGAEETNKVLNALGMKRISANVKNLKGGRSVKAK